MMNVPVATQPPSRRRLGGTDAAGGIYGTIVATAVVAGAATHGQYERMLGVTVITLVVFWLAHVYAESLGHHLQNATGLAWSTVTRAMARERPMLVGPLPLLALLLLGAVGLLDENLAVNLALWAGVVQLAAWGVVYARLQGWGWA